MPAIRPRLRGVWKGLLRSIHMLLGSHLECGDDRIIVGPQPGQVIVDDEPRNLAFDARVPFGRGIFRPIECPPPYENRVLLTLPQ